MTRPEGTPDPGAPEVTDEEAVDAKFVQRAPMSPEAEAVVPDDVDHVAAADVEEENLRTVVDDELKRGGPQ